MFELWIRKAKANGVLCKFPNVKNLTSTIGNKIGEQADKQAHKRTHKAHTGTLAEKHAHVS